MHLLRSVKIRHAIAFGIGAAVGILYFLSAVNANALTVAGVSIAGNGQTIVSGATVTRVGSTEIIAVSSWGSAKIVWRLIPSGSTHFSPQRNGESLGELVHVGETIGFSGVMDQKADSPTLYTSMIRNETVVQRSAVLDGQVVAADADGLTVATETGTSTIVVSTGTIMTKDGNRTQLADLLPGETIKAFGTFNARDRVLDATRLAAVSLPKIPNTGAPETIGLIETVVAWLRARGGTLSLR